MATSLEGSPVAWVAPSALWSSALAGLSISMANPVLLHFKSKKFLQDFNALLEHDPARLAGALAQSALPGQLKLYQPIHTHFYLILASLVDSVPGQPDHAVDSRRKEKVGFVLRRLSADGEEMAWAVDPTQAPPANKTWLTLANDQRGKSVPNETLFRLLPASYQARGEKRRMWAGYVATSSSETYINVASGHTHAKFDPSGETRYVLRCVYQRPPAPLAVVSESTMPFFVAPADESDDQNPLIGALDAARDKLRSLLAQP